MSVLISVVIPTYNRADLVKRSIDSVLSQGGDFFEVVVVDDGSQDRTKEVLESYKASPFFSFYCFAENKGVNAARNFGVKMAKGEYVLFLDSDDYLNDGGLAEAFRVISLEPDRGHFWFNCVDENTGLRYEFCPVNKELIGYVDRIRTRYIGDFVHLLRRNFLLDIRFLEEFRAMEDLCWVQISRKYGPERYIDFNMVVCKRDSPDSLLNKMKVRSLEQRLEDYRATCKFVELFEEDYLRYDKTRLFYFIWKAIILGIFLELYSENREFLSRVRCLGILHRKVILGLNNIKPHVVFLLLFKVYSRLRVLSRRGR